MVVLTEQQNEWYKRTVKEQEATIRGFRAMLEAHEELKAKQATRIAELVAAGKRVAEAMEYSCSYPFLEQHEKMIVARDALLSVIAKCESEAK
jgi:hypothetical protein